MVSVKVLVILTIGCVDHIFGKSSYTPILLWHGMGDACCFPYSLGAVQVRLNKTYPGIRMLSLKFGKNVIEDVENSYFMHPNKQIEQACREINGDPDFANGYNAIGFSQGSQFLRGLAQRCPNPPMKSYVSLGGQHQGVYGLPNCISLSHPTCDYIRRMLNRAAYLKWLQDVLVQATYWHDPLNEKMYREGSTFLADINNERYLNHSYIKNLKALENMIFVKFERDSMVQPVESEWFGFYKPGQAKEVETLQESDLYINDRLGLKEMDEAGKLHFFSQPGDHLEFEWSWFVDNVLSVYFDKPHFNFNYDSI